MAAYQTILWKVEVTKSEACGNGALQSQPILIKVTITHMKLKMSSFSEFKHKSDYESSYPLKQAAFDIVGSFTCSHSVPTVSISFGRQKKKSYPIIFFSCFIAVGKQGLHKHHLLYCLLSSCSIAMCEMVRNVNFPECGV